MKDTVVENEIVKRNIASIDYLKAVLIIFVIINHSKIFEVSNPIYLFMIRMAVPCFLMLSGWIFSMSSSGIEFYEMYNIHVLSKRFLRFTIPVLITYMVYICTFWCLGKRMYAKDIILDILLGNYGPGAYYYLIMVQFILLFPILFFLVKKMGFHGVILIGLCNFIFELLCVYYSIDKEIYDILIGRYLLFIGTGIYFNLNNNQTIKNEHLLILLIVGMMYLLLPYYFGYKYKIFKYWSDTSMMVIGLIAPVFYLFFQYCLDCKLKGRIGRIWETIGKASYHIMCTQMIWFKCRKYIFSILQVRGGYYQLRLT